jgi:AraC family transcriptional regulator of arabinose operon
MQGTANHLHKSGMTKTLGLEKLDVVLNASGVFRCTTDWSLDSNWSKGLVDYDLWYVWGGLGRMVTSDGVVDLYPGQGIWMRPGRHYEATHNPDALLRVTAIHFQLRNKTRFLRTSEFVPPVEFFEPVDPEYFQSAVAHVVHLRSRFGLPDRAALLLKSLLLEIVAFGAPKKSESALHRHHKLALNPVIAMIRDQPEARFTVSELAAKAGYSPDHFVRLFRTTTGQSPKEFMIRQRMEKALALLKESSHTVTQIADLLGYQDIAFFSRQFKEHLGISPDHFRQRGTKVGSGEERI